MGPARGGVCQLPELTQTRVCICAAWSAETVYICLQKQREYSHKMLWNTKYSTKAVFWTCPCIGAHAWAAGLQGPAWGRPGLPRACSGPPSGTELSPAARPLGLRGRNAGWAEGWGEKCEREVCKYQGQRRSTENHCFLSVSWLANCKMWKNTSLRFPWVLGEGRINACEILGYHGNWSLRKGYGEINCLASRTGLNIT